MLHKAIVWNLGLWQEIHNMVLTLQNHGEILASIAGSIKRILQDEQNSLSKPFVVKQLKWFLSILSSLQQFVWWLKGNPWKDEEETLNVKDP